MTEKKQEQSAPPRKAYVRPKLIAYGNVRDFTRAGTGSKGEKGGGFFKT